nr:preprotein translocase subunit SecG [Sphingorhabdus sp.]
MGLFHFLLVVFAINAASLVGVILMQRSEGGGLGMGGSPAGLLSARGAGDFLTRTTAILATTFILLAIALAFVSAKRGTPGE